MKHLTVTKKMLNTKGWRLPQEIESIDFAPDVKSIKNYACVSNNLKSVTIPQNIISIETGAFMLCTSLTSVTIPDSVTTIGENAFSWCESLESVMILADSLTSIGKYAFLSCDNIKDDGVVFSGTINPTLMKNYPWGLDSKKIVWTY